MSGRVFSFPNPVNEVAARLVAAQVVILTGVILLANQPWLLALLTYGFLARVLTGPTLSPMGLLATRVLVPKLGLPYRPTAGPPKRFAQLIGLVFSGTALLLWPVMGFQTAGIVVLAVLGVFASLESVAGFCAGCFVFNLLMKWGFIPEATCQRCQNVLAKNVISVDV